MYLKKKWGAAGGVDSRHHINAALKCQGTCMVMPPCHRLIGAPLISLCTRRRQPCSRSMLRCDTMTESVRHEERAMGASATVIVEFYGIPRQRAGRAELAVPAGIFFFKQKTAYEFVR